MVTFELFDMLDGGNPLNFFSLQLISLLLSVHLRKILRLSDSRVQEKERSESLHTGLEPHRCLKRFESYFHSGIDPASFPWCPFHTCFFKRNILNINIYMCMQSSVMLANEKFRMA